MHTQLIRAVCLEGFLFVQNWTALTDNKGDYGRIEFRNCHLTNLGDLVAGEFAEVPSGK